MPQALRLLVPAILRLSQQPRPAAGPARIVIGMNPLRLPDGPSAPRRAPPGARGNRGFTLIELMVAVAMVAILSAVAAPSFTAMMMRSAIRSASSDLGTDINMARAEAIRVGGRVSICARSAPTATTCGSDWRQGWLVFREAGTTGIGTFGAGDRLLREHAGIHQDLTLARTTGAGALTFMASGALQPDGLSPVARLELRAAGQKGRDLEVSVIGRLATVVEP
jgi:type IV fimbrial biogenesis protein FimT